MLMEWIVSASALAAAVLLLRTLFRKRISQRLQYWLWLPVLVRLLVPVPLFRAPVSVSGAAAELAPAVFAPQSPAPAELPSVTARPSGAAQPGAAPASVAPGGSKESAAPASTPAPAVTAAPASAASKLPVVSARPDPVQPRSFTPSELLARLWLVGSLASGLWLLGVNLRFAQCLRESRRELRRGRLPVYVTSQLASPCLFGLFRPAVYLTPACAEGPEERQAQVLLHEETHFRQGDHIWGSLRCLALAVWWWNPLVWLAAACSRRDGELCCDEKVMKRLGETQRLDYGRTLVDLLPAKAPRPILSAATLSGGGRAMKQRLERIVKKPKRWLAAAAAVLLLAAFAVGCAFAGKPKETPEPSPTPTLGPGEEFLLAESTPEEIERISYHLYTWETYTLRRGMEGFDEALSLMLALRGTPCGDPASGPSVKRTLDYGSGEASSALVNLRFDGERVLGLKHKQWLDLSAMGRPDEDLAGIFESCGERYVPEPVPANDRGRIEDGSMTATAEYPTYDYSSIQAAIRQAREYYLSAGDHYLPADAGVKLILTNCTGGEMNCGEIVLQALRDGEWMWISSYPDYGSTGTPTDVPADGPAEAVLYLPMYDDPLTPGRYRAAVYYGVPDNHGLLDLYYERVAYAEFEITEGAPAVEGGGEKLMGDAKPEKVKTIEYRDRFDHYYLDRGEMGFDTALGLLFSLEGSPCEEPEILFSRRFDLGVGPNITLAYDGEQVYGQRLTDRWLLLDGPGRPDQDLTDIFLYWGREETPEAAVPFPPSWLKNRIEDGSLTAETESPTVDLAAVRASLEALKAVSRERGEQPEELVRDLAVPVRLKNNTEDPVYVAYDMELLVLRDGEWLYIPWRNGIISLMMGTAIEPGQELTGLGVPLSAYDKENLTPGKYRVCVNYKLGGESGNTDHAAFAEFEITDGPAKEKVYIPLSRDYPAAEGHEAYHLSFRVPAGWSAADLSPEKAAERGLLYLYSGTEDRHYIRDEAGKIIGAFGCASYEAAEGAEDQPQAVYARLALGDGYRFDLGGSYTPAAQREFGENARVDVVYSAAFLRPFTEQPEEKRNEGFLSYDRSLGVYAAVELEPGVLTEEEMDTLARSLYLEHEGPRSASPAPMTEQEVLKAYDAAREAYSWFVSSSIPDSAFVDRTDVREDHYYRVTDSRFADWETLENYLRSLFDDETVQNLLPGAYKEIDGHVYAASADAGSDVTVGRQTELRVLREEEGKFVVSVTYQRMDYLTTVGSSTYEFGYVWQGDRWAFDGFFLPEYEGGPLPEQEPSPEPTPAPTPMPMTTDDPKDWLPLAEGEYWLPDEEVEAWQRWFDEDRIRPQFLRPLYGKPEDVDLSEVFYNGLGIPVTGEDIRASLLHLGRWETECPTDKLPRQEMSAVLEEYLGLTLSETWKVGLDWSYLPETDSYYHPHGDTNAMDLRIICGARQDDMVRLFYNSDSFRRVELDVSGGNVRFVSNMALLMLTNMIGYGYDEPLRSPGENLSGDYGRDITVLTPEAEVFGSYEEAREATENMVYTSTSDPGTAEERETVLGSMEIRYEQEFPGCGTLLYGEIAAGLPHGNPAYLFFITLDGRRYALPIPIVGFSAAVLDTSSGREAEEGQGFQVEFCESEGMIRWWIRCAYETNPGLGLMPKQGGYLRYTLYLPTMELFILFEPED